MTARPSGTLALNAYGRYQIPPGLERRPAARAVLDGAVYEPQTIGFMRDHAGSGDVIHAGTFFGDFLPALSSALAPGAMLWAFEPNPDNHRYAETTVAMNGLRNVTLTAGALSNQEGALLFRTRDDQGAPIGGLSHVTKAEEPGVETVQGLLLDYVVPRTRQVSILQLDVEGHEKQALKGAYHLISRCQPILILENMGQVQWLNRSFRSVEYRLIGKLHANFVFVPKGSAVTL